MKIMVVGMPSEPIHEFASGEDMVAAAPAHGWTLTGYEDMPHLNEALRGMPKFMELHGPAGGGDSVRYETWEANNLYSSKNGTGV
ncbi:hypothetical protein K9B33_17925 [Sphingobium sp. 3R8]|uniref:hypothetical protein n=1 Tax=Sphingobium sp. 3R8 TaxID=2874921 RepID=UPI001CCFEC32|nr:hypothetical protein [Sphingobium sp. 3R8]MBZ9649417.1 hypothetical protein [Sphingobium sp. 3R8]